MRAPIQRDPVQSASTSYDLIIVGSGIYGACLALEAARRGMRPLLLERDDFCGATSNHSLRILHGGLRYLQHLDLTRFSVSVRERTWFLRNFPDLVEPLPCLMPLYNLGVRRTSLMRCALRLNDLLSKHRNDGVADHRQLPDSSLLDVSQTKQAFPEVDGIGLRGGARWCDALMLNPPRLLVELLRWACGAGATALNYVEATRLLAKGGRVTGVEAHDHESGTSLRFKAPVVVNCAGPWCRALARTFHREMPRLFHPSLAFNLLLDRPALSDHTLAVSPKRPGSRTYFLLPYKDRVLAGTYHTHWSSPVQRPEPTPQQLNDMLEDLNQAIPQLSASAADVVRVMAGLLPAERAGSHVQSKRPIIQDHAAQAGPPGLFSVSGVKYTTARAVAERTLRKIYPHLKTVSHGQDHAERQPVNSPLDLEHFTLTDEAGQHEIGERLRQLVDEEAVLHLDDLIIRRTDWSGDARRTMQIGKQVAGLLGWQESRQTVELNRLELAAHRLGMPVEPSPTLAEQAP